MSELWSEKRTGNSVVLSVSFYVQPRASRTEIVGVHDKSIKLRVAAPPVEGEANDEVIRFFSKFFSIPKSSVVIRRGEQSRHKTVDFLGMSADDFKARLQSAGVTLE